MSAYALGSPQDTGSAQAKVALPQSAAVSGASDNASRAAVIAWTDWLLLLHDTLPTPYEPERYPAVSEAVINDSHDAYRPTFAAMMRVVDEVVAMNAAAAAAAAATDAAAAAAARGTASALGASGHAKHCSGRRLPYEILFTIMEAADPVMYAACARADPVLRRHALSAVRFDTAHIVRRLRTCMAVEHKGSAAQRVLNVANGSMARVSGGRDDCCGEASPETCGVSAAAAAAAAVTPLPGT